MPNNGQQRINALARKLSMVGDLMMEARAVAFDLAKAGNREGIFQLRGAASGATEAAKATESFLTSLHDILNRIPVLSFLGGSFRHSPCARHHLFYCK